VSRTTVLLVGRGATATRLRSHLRRHYRVRHASDCGSALEALRREVPGAVVLDVAGAGYAAAEFREMLEADHPGLPVLELPGGDAASLRDESQLVQALERALEGPPRPGAAEPPPPPPTPTAAEPESEAGGEPSALGGDAPLAGWKFEDLTSRNPRMLELFELIPRVARTDSPVLIHGETGTGKELVAAAIHRQSRRKDGPFFTVNCGALTDTLLESELFGHEKGAFTGAYRRKEGYFELASGGTLFLDELGTISAAMQVKLLRVLERMEVRRVGGGDTVRVDVRIVSATNARLEDAVAAGTFREDLYYRINVVQLFLPPLRERPEDVTILADLFRGTIAKKQGREVLGFDRAAERLLTGYPWPGNVRELQNVIERAVILATGAHIQEKDLPERLRRGAARKFSLPSFDAEEPLPAVLGRLSVALEREYLKRVLRKYRGHVGRTAEHSGLNRRTLYNKMREHGLKREEFR
jgi:DNA-binding NtrC family response regulator